MIGARIGARIGANIGAAISTDPLGGGSGPAPTWTKDATNNIGIPQTLTEWNNVMSASGMAGRSPFMLWYPGTPASGNVSDQIGTFVGTASGTGLTYQQAVAGWTTKALTYTDAGTGVLNNVDAGLPDISTTSFTILVYEQLLAAPAATRSMLTLGTTVVDQEFLATPRNHITCGANNTNGTLDPTGSVRANFLEIDRTNSAAALHTNQENLVPAFGATATGKRIRVGGAGAASPPVAVLMVVGWQGAAAEFTLAQRRTLGTTLGWTMA